MKVTSKLFDESVHWVLSFNPIIEQMCLNSFKLQKESFVYADIGKPNSLENQRFFFLKT